MRAGTIGISIMITLFSALALAKTAPGYWQAHEAGTLVHRGLVQPRSELAIGFNMDSGAVYYIKGGADSLAPDIEQAIQKAPTWLWDELKYTFTRLSASKGASLAAILLNSAEPRLNDEIAFVIARTAPEDLEKMPAALIVENATWIYRIADKLAYVQLVEWGDPAGGGDFGTTIKLRYLSNGTPAWWEVPPKYYYWYVVHPKLDVEDPVYIDPTTGEAAAPPTGVFWRPYLYQGKEDHSYHRHRITRLPQPITDDDLASWNYGGSKAHAGLIDFEINPLEIIRSGDGKAKVLTLFTRGDNRVGSVSYPNPDGMYLSTTIPVEKLAAEGHSQLLTNMLRFGAGTHELFSNTIVSFAQQTCYGCHNGQCGNYAYNGGVLEGRKVLILRDRLPFGLPEDPNEKALQDWGRAYDVRSSAELSTLLLYTDSPHLNAEYNKIIIPSDQPLSLYQALVDNSAKLETFVDYGGTLQLHGATSPADDWAGLRMPGGYTCAPQDSAGALQTLSVYGYPLLSDVLRDAQYLWDEVNQPGLYGDRSFDENGTVLDRLGWWVSQNMTYRVAEEVALSRKWCPFERIRSILVPRIAWNHYGNCGELQDILGAGARTALVPVQLTSNSAEDHVWNEFFFKDRWRPYQVSWSCGPTHIDHWGVAMDKDTGGGGKDCSVIFVWRGDGWTESAIGRYPTGEENGRLTGDYTRHVTLDISVFEGDRPIAGADIFIVTEAFYDPSSLTMAGMAWTGPDGKAAITVGENRSYYIHISSPLGTFPTSPPGTTLVQKILDKADALPGHMLAFEHRFNDLAILPQGTTVAPPIKGSPLGAPWRRLKARVKAPKSFLSGTNQFNGISWTRVGGPTKVDVYVLDADNYAYYSMGRPFQTVYRAEGVQSADIDLPLPGGLWCLVISNHKVLISQALLDISAGIKSWKWINFPIPLGGGGCTVSHGGPIRLPWLFLTVIALWLLRPRRRR